MSSGKQEIEWLLEWEGRTLADLWRDVSHQHAEREFLVDGRQRLTYGQVGSLVEDVARGLIAAGVRNGDRVAIWMPNGIPWVVAEFAVILAAGVMVPVSTRFGSHDLEYILKQSGAVAVLMVGQLGKIDFQTILDEAMGSVEVSADGALHSTRLPELRWVVGWGDSIRPELMSVASLIDRGARISTEDLRQREASIHPRDVVNIPYTSGTTGFPKGVMTTHEQYLGQTVCFRQRLGLRDGDRFLAVAPFFANFGNYFGVLLPAMVGGCTVLLGGYDPGAALALVEKERITHFSGTPTMYADIFAHPNLSQTDVSSLRTAMTGAAPAPVQMIRDVYEKLQVELICNGYGMTENSGCTTMTRAGDPPEVLAQTTGSTLPGVSACIKDPTTGEFAGTGRVGELCTKGWNVMQGYFRMEEETAQCIDADGWFHTGDLGMLDEQGNFIITGRLKEMYITGGFNVYPAEVESFLCGLEGVAQVAIVGVPDERMGEVGAAFVVKNPGSQVQADEVKAFCKNRIAGYKTPRHVLFVDELPLVGVGKVKKSELLRAWELEQGGTGAAPTKP